MAVNVAVTASPFPRRLALGAGTGKAGGRRDIAHSPVARVCALAWVLLLATEVTGLSGHLHHDAVVRAGGPAWAGLGLFLIGWLAMVAAMMLPATLWALRRSATASALPPVAPGPFLGGFVAVWGAAGWALLSFDMAVHRAVEALPVLGARPWVVAAALLGVAGTAQLAPWTRRHLSASARVDASAVRSPWAEGVHHAVRCLAADGPLMLVMFAAGASLGWMVLLTAVMAAERSSRAGLPVAVASGLALVATAALTILHPAWLPAAFAAG